ncbi:hypothetical protein CHARACLAT_002103 [Characodon lateralis]|uniref:Uncharacterized protein n=1 Tax=Characodon lateralis TaxID=208331 RepID=A0ABU7DML5_9TELE|nr:hypothetical protein [Characodon lateralis]
MIMFCLCYAPAQENHMKPSYNMLLPSSCMLFGPPLQPQNVTALRWTGNLSLDRRLLEIGTSSPIEDGWMERGFFTLD